MSWFDTSGLASIAKTALKEAQRTIDKALDIREEATQETSTNITTHDTIITEESLKIWRMAHSETIIPTKIQNKLSVLSQKDIIPNRSQTSIWGSFTGSFFDTNRSPKSSSIDSLDDTSIECGSEHFNKSKLVVVEDGDGQLSRISSSDADEDTLVEESINRKLNENKTDSSFKEDQTINSNKTKNENLNHNSIDSRNSSESVELITCSTECTTSPESDVLTPVISSSSSVLGLKQTSDSVEIIGDSQTSPSSVEILDEFSSPLESPNNENNIVLIEKSLRDNAELVPEDESIAEDTMSYTSVSENTSITVLDTSFVTLQTKPAQIMLKDAFHNDQHSIDAITKIPKRLHLNFNLIDTQPQGNQQNLSEILNTTNIIDIPIDKKNDTIGDKNFLENSNTNNNYLKNLIADAMTEKLLVNFQLNEMQESAKSSTVTIENIARDNSPLSSESRSDMVKISSASDHTSGDELETTTSSDIEIISSPNGDSSSTQSRQSPMKQNIKLKEDDTKDLLFKMAVKKAKGHTRELSEASSISDDFGEIDRLIKRLSEMSEILESREAKLIDLNRQNAELTEINGNLKYQLDSMLTKELQSADLSQLTEDYTQRLSALEKRFQQAIREKDQLRKQWEISKNEAATRLSQSELDTILEEKNQIIKELREEGEKLSKQQLQHSNIIKKLRNKERDSDLTIKNLKENMELLTLENERLKRNLTAKEEIERSQIDAIHQLTSQNKKIDCDLLKLQSQNDDLQQKYETTIKSLDIVKIELMEKKREIIDLQHREQTYSTIQEENRLMEEQKNTMLLQLENIHKKLRTTEQELIKKDQKYRSENNELRKRLEIVETNNEELAQNLADVGKPLLRQLEQIQIAHALKVENYEKRELEMSINISDLQTQLDATLNDKKITLLDYNNLEIKYKDLEEQFKQICADNEKIKFNYKQLELNKNDIEIELKKEISIAQSIIEEEKRKYRIYIKNMAILEAKLQGKHSNNDENKKEVDKNQLKGNENLQNVSDVDNVISHEITNSSTLSVDKISGVESLWWQDEQMDITPAPLGPTSCANIFEMQTLQTNLKQREGELKQLQWELQRREEERCLLNKEISRLINKVDENQGKVKEYEMIKETYIILQDQYDALCQLFGEKVEENEELRLDLQDVKEMYKSQIDELLNQQKQNK